MKLCFPDSTTWSLDETGLKLTPESSNPTKALTFAKENDGSFTAVAPIKVRTGDSDSKTYLTKVRLSCETERNAKSGLRRTVLKVEMPYMALDPLTEGENLSFSPARSKKTISAHIVLSLPKEAQEDITGQSVGDAGVRCAASHIAALLTVLRLVAGRPETVGDLTDRRAVPLVYNDAEGTVYIPDTWEIDPSRLHEGVLPVEEGVTLGDTESLGFGILANADYRSMVEQAKSPLIRALMGLAPLDSDQDYGSTTQWYHPYIFAFEP